MSVVQAKLTILNINQTVPHAARSWQGTIQSCSAGEGCCSSGDLELIGYRRDDCQLEFWNLCQETFQNFIVKHSNKINKMVHRAIGVGWSTRFPLRSALGMVFVMLESTVVWALHSLGGSNDRNHSGIIASPWNLSEVKPT